MFEHLSLQWLARAREALRGEVQSVLVQSQQLAAGIEGAQQAAVQQPASPQKEAATQVGALGHCFASNEQNIHVELHISLFPVLAALYLFLSPSVCTAGAKWSAGSAAGRGGPRAAGAAAGRQLPGQCTVAAGPVTAACGSAAATTRCGASGCTTAAAAVQCGGSSPGACFHCRTTTQQPGHNSDSSSSSSDAGGAARSRRMDNSCWAANWLHHSSSSSTAVTIAAVGIDGSSMRLAWAHAAASRRARSPAAAPGSPAALLPVVAGLQRPGGPPSGAVRGAAVAARWRSGRCWVQHELGGVEGQPGARGEPAPVGVRASAA